MKTEFRRKMDKAVAFVTLFCTVAQPTYALTLATEPLFLANRVAPKVMLALSKDQQLYKKAYNDYSDLDGDGAPETTYKHSITYYGYFDPVKCYAYTTNNRFEPTGVTTYTVSVNSVAKTGSAYCDSANNPSTGRWSGNFLNWVSMSRMDAVRKLLYGGLRQVDTGSDTVLERSYLPTDAHAWAKYYNGSDIAKLTPFTTTLSTQHSANVETTSTVTLTRPTSSTDIGFKFRSDLPYSQFFLGDQVRLAIEGQPTQHVIGAIMTSDGNRTMTIRVNPAGFSAASISGSKWTITNLSSTGISFCNLTPGTSTMKSHTNTNAPVIRVARGNYALWNANEVLQCLWHEERTNLQAGFGGVRSNGNQASLSEIDAGAENPSRVYHALGTGAAAGEYNARVKVCVADLQGTEKCQKYPSGNLKPVGLLQGYGDKIDFGLMTGTYAKNISGGVLRKAPGPFANEVNSATNGTFTSANGIVRTLNAMRIYGYDYATGTYIGSAGDNCTYQLTDLTQNSCTSWGNPMSEIYFEALRYFAAKDGVQASSDYTYTPSGSKDDALGLPLVQTWTPPVNAQNACAKLNVLVFNASVSTNDDDLGSISTSEINGGNATVAELTNAVGSAEGIHNNSFYIGKRMSDTIATPGFELCTAKTITALGEVSGICPEGPTLGGSYLIAGLARHARTTKLRTDLDDSNAVKRDSGPGGTALKVTSYGIQLATNTPSLEIAVPGSTTGQKVVIQPIYRLDLGTRVGGGALVDMKYVRTSLTATRSTGKVYINWEDSEQGGDYDQDMWGTLEWELDATAKTITITTNAISASTSNPQGFGYTIGGTTKDGPHFHSGILGFNFTDTVTAVPANVAGCSNCRVSSDSAGQRGEQSVTYTLDNKVLAGNLKDPLWYLAKYGGFNDLNKNGQLDGDEWDVYNNLTGEPTKDGIPDTYFLVTNPLGLEAALERAFRGIAQDGSGTAVASSSTSIRSGNAIYAARFTTSEWSGKFSAYRMNDDGTLGGEDWEASRKLPTHDKRLILTYRDDKDGRRGVPFRWPGDAATAIGQDAVDALNQRPDVLGTSDGRGKERLNYLRGDGSLEGNALQSFRFRGVSKLGDIVNSSPAYVPAVPSEVILDPTYVDFQTAVKASKRPPMIYVGANDGMLHGFEATVPGGSTAATNGGVERIAYVPSKTFPHLNQLTNPNYVHRYYVDGSPTAADVKLNLADGTSKWRTVLVGALGAGGRGIYALDVTEPLDNVTEGDAAKRVLWEFNVDDDDAPRTGEKFGLGYVLGQPVIRRVADAGGRQRWAAIVSGGYNNTELVPGKAAGGDGVAYLYVIFLDGPKGIVDGRTRWREGDDYVRIPTVGSKEQPNGLAPPFVTDTNANGIADYVYAGDLHGNFWKFDISASDQKQWDNTNNRVALFTTPSGQPITAPAKGVFHPTGQGFLLMFGTGKYLELTDPLPTSQKQGFYGIWDKDDKPNKIGTQAKVLIGDLLEQTINQATPENGTVAFRYITNAQGVKGPNWATQKGWFMTFTAPGERSVFEPVVAARRLIFTTLIPSGSACDFGGTSFIMVLNPATGGEFDTAVLDTTGNGKLEADDKVASHFASGFQSSVGIVTTPRMLMGGVPAGEAAGKDTSLLFGDKTGRVAGPGNRRAGLFFQGVDGTMAPLVLLGAGRDSGRVSWREVVKQ